MKPLILSALCLAAGVSSMSTRAASQESDRSASHPRYTLSVLSSLGGASSAGESINNQGWIAGRSNLPGDQSRHATLWRDGVLTDLNTLGGPNSAVLWPVKNQRGVITGIAQTGEPDLRGERWSCSFFFPAASATGFRCLGFRWQNGAMTPLPTLGGTHSFATGTNNSLRTVGWAETLVEDATCTPPQVLQFLAVVWGPDGNVARRLLPVHEDTTSAATAINDRGEVVGISGDCDQSAGRFSARHMVLWDRDGAATLIPALGAFAWNTPNAINERGDVVGFANASAADEGAFNPRAFFWRRNVGTQPLMALPGHVTTQATGINEHRQIVGQSCDASGGCRAVIWRHGRIADLNTLLKDKSPLVLTSANDIDDRGRITGQAQDPVTGEFLAVIATPRY
jgi:probable HAF family extracellular repeat protein